MNKEQTPKDFESYLEQMGYSWNDFDYTSSIEGLVEQYAQAKVLEALEREVPKAYEIGWNEEVMGTPFEGWGIEHIMETRKKKYYETQVKPKYE